MTTEASLDYCQDYPSLFCVASFRLLAAGRERDLVEITNDSYGLSLRSVSYLVRLLSDDGLVTLTAVSRERITFCLTDAGHSLLSDISG